MKSSVLLTLLPLCLSMIGCDSQPSGLLQQRIAELETQCDAARKRADQLQAKLDTRESGVGSAVSKNEDQPSDDSKNQVAAAAMNLADTLREKVKPGMLSAYVEAAWAGFRVEKAGESHGVAVPFFRDLQGQWVCGWSENQILEVLGSQPSGSHSQKIAIPGSEVPPLPPGGTQTPPGEVEKKSAPPGDNKSYFVDPATGKLYRIKPDGSREAMPELR